MIDNVVLSQDFWMSDKNIGYKYLKPNATLRFLKNIELFIRIDQKIFEYKSMIYVLVFKPNILS